MSVMAALLRAARVALALGRGERGDGGRLESAVLADIRRLLAAFVERMASLLRAIWMPLAERRRQTVHRRRLVSAVFAVVVLHRRGRKRNQSCKAHRRNNHDPNNRHD